ncbi:Transmembrane amino acid transporter family protein [Striga hermonthica]|uniref:Transmembrane amino acid transporter family protein n=1 Tax=Striga hermonthica TaxID=68872 RepID=A0A9N7N4R0_STRHE|nr:Transmembrane amino acid transporter family protein [Striga hermonthica]
MTLKAPLILPQETEPINANNSFNRQEFNGASYTGAVLNLSTTIIGAGIMALPAAMKVLGLGPGVAAIVLVAILTEVSLDFLLRFSKAGRAVTYGGVMGDSFGVVGKKLLQVCILTNNAGVLVVYMIIIGDVLSGSSSSGVHHAGVLEGWFGEQWWNKRFFVLLVTTLFVFTPLAFFKRIDSLRHSSAVAVFLAFVFVFITAAICVYKLLQGTIKMPRFLPLVTEMSSVWALFTVVPVLVTAYVCHFNVHNIETELQDPSTIRSVVRTSLALCSFTYIMTSFFGFLLFGDSTLDDVLSNFDTNLDIPFGSMLNDVVRISYALHLMLVFPVIFYSLRLNVDGLIFPNAACLADNNVRFGWITCGLLCVIFLCANFVPSIWDAFQFTGSTSTVCIGFIFPASIALRDIHCVISKKDRVLAVFMIGLAIFTSLVAIYSDAYAIFKKKNE